MFIIAISADSYCMGEEIGEEVSRKMDYPFLGAELVAAAAGAFNVPEAPLKQALTKTPSLLERFTGRTQRHIAYLEATLCEHMLGDDLVYLGLLGFPLLQSVAHVLKVRITANTEDRLRRGAIRENLAQEDVSSRIHQSDEQCRKWFTALYGLDVTRSALFDLVINVGRMEPQDREDAVETITTTVRHKKFQPTTYSLNCMKNIAMSCRVRAALIESHADVSVKSNQGTVYVFSKSLNPKKQKEILSFKDRVMKMEGVEHVEVYNDKSLFKSVAHGQ
ncbi:MAG: cytidylate kinase-like family protein [Desulfobacterales bacterium]|nr:cytidylate kinase-like family protein [Desulfobacterales bacterium]